MSESNFPFLIHTPEVWKNYPYFEWTDEEIENADKETGLIGKKHGIYCYVTRLIPFAT